MILKTKFRFWAFLMCGCFVVLSFILPLFFTLWIADMNAEVPVMALFAIGLLWFTWFWLLSGELRTKAIAAELNPELLTVKRFMGLIPSGVFNLK
ncbi:MAG: hypothetical protein K2X48_12550 [Chitinophagaceae bacterium]|nr:hypothetical protein [Chitinophagaceae bacterium]